jgi:flavin-dependent dehydrogenase
MLLARSGFDVLLVDRSHFPSDIPHGHFIHRDGPARLHEWGLLDAVLATGCPAITAYVEDLGDGIALRGDDLRVDGAPAGLGPRRTALDAVLVGAAADAGAEVREGFPVEALTVDDGRVTGIRSLAGTHERARIVVGADGRNSRIARQVAAPTYQEVPTLTCWYFSYWGGVECDALELYVRDGRVMFAFPSNDELLTVFVSWPIELLDSIRSDPERGMMEAIRAIPSLGERVLGGSRVERIYGAASLPNFLRRPHGDGWALVGDAGCHKDPYLALGICDAFRDAQLLADALTSVFSDERSEADALADYERRRNAATLPDYEKNIALARGEAIPADVLAQRAEVLGDASAIRAYFLESEQRLG